MSDPIEVDVEDSDIADRPAELKLEIYACGDDTIAWLPVRTMLVSDTTGSHAFTWDGKDDFGEYVEPGAYTYRVTVTQDVPQRVLVSPDGASTTWPAYDDEATYRSTFLSIDRSRDKE